MIFADKLIMLRKKNGMSQEDLANEIGVSRQSVSKWEGAQSVPDLAKMVKISRFFGVSTDYLLKDELEEPEEPNKEAEVQTEARVEEKPDEYAVHMTIGEVTDFFKRTNLTSLMKSLSIAGMLLCPAIAVFFQSVVKSDIASLTATAVSLLTFLVILFVAYGMERKYNILKTQPVELEYGGAGIAEDILSKKGRAYRLMKVIGIVSVITAVACCIFAIVMALLNRLEDSPWYLEKYGIAGWIIAEILFAVGTFLLILSSTRTSNIYCILEEGKLSRSNKKRNAGIRLFSFMYIGVYVIATVLCFFVNLTLGFVVAIAGLSLYAILYSALVSSLIKSNKIGKKP